MKRWTASKGEGEVILNHYNQQQQGSRTMKGNTSTELKIYEDHPSKGLFLQDPKSDFFLIIEDRIMPLHKNAVRECLYFEQASESHEKVHFIKTPLSIKAIEKVLACLYGFPLELVRDSQTMKIIEVAKFFKIKRVEQALMEDITNNFQEYGIFSLYEIAKVYGIDWLSKRCLDELISCQFEQFHINRYDLMTIGQDIFEEIIKYHRILTCKGFSEGLQSEKIKNLIQQYSETNQTKIDLEDLNSFTPEEYTRTRAVTSEWPAKQTKEHQKKRKSTWNCSVSKLPEQSSPGIDKKHSAITQQSTTSEKDTKELTDINSTITKRSNTMLSEIKEAQASLTECDSQQENRKIDKLNKKLSEMACLMKEQQRMLTRVKDMARQVSTCEKRKSLQEKRL